jgi:hypothetical protein
MVGVLCSSTEAIATFAPGSLGGKPAFENASVLHQPWQRMTSRLGHPERSAGINFAT